MIDTIEKEDTIISEEEAAQYDRQIRLWGLDAQKRFVDKGFEQKTKLIYILWILFLNDCLRFLKT